jgi:hypothetical protein
LRNGDLKDAVFINTSLEFADLTDTKLMGSIFFNVNMDNANLKNVSWGNYKVCDLKSVQTSDPVAVHKPGAKHLGTPTKKSLIWNDGKKKDSQGQYLVEMHANKICTHNDVELIVKLKNRRTKMTTTQYFNLTQDCDIDLFSGLAGPGETLSVMDVSKDKQLMVGLLKTQEDHQANLRVWKLAQDCCHGHSDQKVKSTDQAPEEKEYLVPNEYAGIFRGHASHCLRENRSRFTGELKKRIGVDENWLIDFCDGLNRIAFLDFSGEIINFLQVNQHNFIGETSVKINRSRDFSGSEIPPRIIGIKYSPQGDMMALQDAAYTVYLLDFKSGHLQSLNLHQCDTDCTEDLQIAFSPDGSLFAVLKINPTHQCLQVFDTKEAVIISESIYNNKPNLHRFEHHESQKWSFITYSHKTDMECLLMTGFTDFTEEGRPKGFKIVVPDYHQIVLQFSLEIDFHRKSYIFDDFVRHLSQENSHTNIYSQECWKDYMKDITIQDLCVCPSGQFVTITLDTNTPAHNSLGEMIRNPDNTSEQAYEFVILVVQISSETKRVLSKTSLIIDKCIGYRRLKNKNVNVCYGLYRNLIAFHYTKLDEKNEISNRIVIYQIKSEGFIFDDSTTLEYYNTIENVEFNESSKFADVQHLKQLMNQSPIWFGDNDTTLVH